MGWINSFHIIIIYDLHGITIVNKKYERIWKIINYFFNLEDRHCDFYKYDFMLK